MIVRRRAHKLHAQDMRRRHLAQRTAHARPRCGARQGVSIPAVPGWLPPADSNLDVALASFACFCCASNGWALAQRAAESDAKHTRAVRAHGGAVRAVLERAGAPVKLWQVGAAGPALLSSGHRRIAARVDSQCFKVGSVCSQGCSSDLYQSTASGTCDEYGKRQSGLANPGKLTPLVRPVRPQREGEA